MLTKLSLQKLYFLSKSADDRVQAQTPEHADAETRRRQNAVSSVCKGFNVSGGDDCFNLGDDNAALRRRAAKPETTE